MSAFKQGPIKFGFPTPKTKWHYITNKANPRKFIQFVVFGYIWEYEKWFKIRRCLKVK
jgi:hypothetical protein